MRIRTTCLTLFIFCAGFISAQDTLRIMSYNILNYSGTSGTITRYTDMKNVIDYVLPDIMICSELIDAAGADLLLNNAFNASGRTYYDRANFVDGPDTDNMLFYNSDKFTLESQNQVSTVLRDISHYRLFYTNGTDTSWLNIFSAHLKASNTSSDINQRLQEVSQFCSYLTAVDPNENVIFGGDFNFYTSTEPGYNYLTSNSCVIRFYDPINSPGSWNGNSSFTSIHTQSTRSNSNPGCCGGSTGGLDDRFDFMLGNSTFINGTGFMQYIPGTYKSVGNDANHFNLALVEGGTNTSVPAAVNTSLFNMSDHLPVIMDVIIQWDLSVATTNGNSFRFHFTGNDLNGNSNFYLLAKQSGTYRFEVLDAFGKCVEKNEIDIVTGDNHFTLGNALSSGIYFVRVYFQDEIFTLKFIR